MVTEHGFAAPTFEAGGRKGLVGQNLSGPAVSTTFLLRELPGRFAVPNEELVNQRPDDASVEVAQRELDPAKADEIARYVVKAAVVRAIRQHPKDAELQRLVSILFGGEEYVPMYFALPTLEAGAFKDDVAKWAPHKVHESSTESIYEFTLPPGARLWLVDGQHRWKGICVAVEFFDREAAGGKLLEKGIFREYGGLVGRPLSSSEAHAWQLIERAFHQMTVTVQIHLELTKWDQFRQAFAVMNLNQKKASTSLGYTWDMNNPVSAWLKGDFPELFGGVDSQIEKSASDSAKIRFDDDDGRMSLRDVVGITSILARGTLSPKRVTPSQVQAAAPTVKKFWKAVVKAGVFKKGSKKASLLAQPAVLKGLATLVHQLRRKFAKRPAEYESALGLVLDSVSADNPLWQHRPNGKHSLWETLDLGYQNPSRRSAIKNQKGANVWDVVSSTITLGDTSQKLGTTVYRFGAKTNDIRRVVADVVRWDLGMQERKARAVKSK